MSAGAWQTAAGGPRRPAFGPPAKQSAVVFRFILLPLPLPPLFSECCHPFGHSPTCYGRSKHVFPAISSLLHQSALVCTKKSDWEYPTNGCSQQLRPKLPIGGLFLINGLANVSKKQKASPPLLPAQIANKIAGLSAIDGKRGPVDHGEQNGGEGESPLHEERQPGQNGVGEGKQNWIGQAGMGKSTFMGREQQTGASQPARQQPTGMRAAASKSSSRLPTFPTLLLTGLLAWPDHFGLSSQPVKEGPRRLHWL
jgi:hypothetical protein